MKNKTIKRTIVFAVLLCLTAVLFGFAAFAAECAEIRNEVLRLHVLANSDTEADQSLKLKVRDAVIAEADGLLDGIDDKESAMGAVKKALPRLREAAQNCVYEQGYGYTVKAELCDMYFTTREYDTGTLPAGVYAALRITIGKGVGHNWWCVVYPSMCLPAAEGSAQWSDVLDDTQTDIVEHPERYEVRLKVVEWVQQLWQYLESLW